MIDHALFRLLTFAPIVLIVYYLLPRRAQNYWLLVTSYLIYGIFHWAFPIALLVITLVNFVLAHEIHSTVRWRHLILTFGIAFNILVLLIAKYTTTISGHIPGPMLTLLWRGISSFNISPETGLITVLLPIGLSFRTLEMISYLIDVSNNRMEPSTDLVDFALYAVYFPKLFAGPIERAKTFLPKLSNQRIVDNDVVAQSFTRIMVGLVQKIVLADTIRLMTPPDLFVTPLEYGGPQLILWLVAYTFALYNDFAGYTSIMRGISGLFGIELVPNFEQPYFARNITEFWNRWHMSFSFWLRDYIFFPVSRALAKRIPNRSNFIHILLPPLITMIASALWHEIAPAMLLWGLLHALYMIGWRIAAVGRPVVTPDKLPAWRQALAMMLTFSLVTLAWVPFALPLNTALQYWSGLLVWQGPPVVDIRVLIIIILTVALDMVQSRGEFAILRWPRLAQSAALALAIMILYVTIKSAFFTSAPFVYQGF